MGIFIGALKTRVKHGASIGANATIVCGHDIGRFAFVAVGAVVTREVPDYALVAGAPARIIGWVCRCGKKLAFAESRSACACRREYEMASGAVRCTRDFDPGEQNG